jgi:DNA recombination protein RmuC
VAYIWILLIIIILLLGLLIYLNIKDRSQSSDSKESLRDLDKAVERQETKLSDLSLEIQSFQDPLSKLNRYLSGGALAGTFGEWALDAIIKDIFHPNQFIENAEVISGSGKRVEFAIKLPEGLLLPIDAKFPSGLYDNYLSAVDSSNSQSIKTAIDAIRRHVINDANDINSKYIQSGITIELGIMFIPSESLMQLIDSISDIREQIFRDSRVLIMGPNSLAAYLISVHMGFRTLAINEKASEIMKEFGKLKKEFENFSSSTAELEKKADAMLKVINEHSSRERQMNKAIKNMNNIDS